MININPTGKKLILSIDGGGLRGMISIAMLAELEKMTGKPCHELFDMVAGTSTGAIIAAGIGLGIPAKDILEDVYRQRLPDAFRAQPSGILLYLHYLFGGLRRLYDWKPFLDALAPFASGKKVGDFNKPIVFMAARDVRTANTYFIVSKGPGAGLFNHWPVVGAVAASGAAPIFFPPVLGNLVDGGVGVHGNPCLAATVEALEYIGASEGFTPNNVIHFSLGTGFLPNTREEGQAGRFWLLDWVKYLIIEVLNDTVLNQVLTTRAIYRSSLDFRRYDPYLQAASVRDVLGITVRDQKQLDDIGMGLSAVDNAGVELMEKIGRAYAQAVDWTEANYMPWLTVGPNKGQGRDGGHPLPGIKPVRWTGTEFDL